MALTYSVLAIFTSEEARFNGQPLSLAIPQRVRDLRLAARCLVTRGIAGCYENGDMATHRVEVLAVNMPIKIEIVLPLAELDRVLPLIDEMVSEGVVLVQDMRSCVHRVSSRVLPRNLLVRDAMTRTPRSVPLTATAADIARILLAAPFNGVPVVDGRGKPVGIVTQGDLIQRAGMPIRIGLLRDLGAETVDATLQHLSASTAAAIMTQPAVTVPESMTLPQAVDCMLKHGHKRLPVVSPDWTLTGMLARVDVFRTVTREQPDWAALGRHGIDIRHAQRAADIMRSDIHTVTAAESVETVMRLIDGSDLQRVAVVDDDGHLLGLISDHDLLRLFTGHRSGLWDRVASRLTFTAMGQRHKAALEDARKRTAGEFMTSKLVTARPDTPIAAVIQLMTEGGYKRLPVVDAENHFLGVVSRDSLLRAGVSSES